MTWDKITDKRILLLSQCIQSKAESFINDCFNELNLNIRISEGFRNIKRQNELYEIGRSKPGEIVTKCRGGYSYHNYGLAFDIVRIINNKISYDIPWLKVLDISNRYDLTWGGKFTFHDFCHFQYDKLFTINDLLSKKI